MEGKLKDPKWLLKGGIVMMAMALGLKLAGDAGAFAGPFLAGSMILMILYNANT